MKLIGIGSYMQAEAGLGAVRVNVPKSSVCPEGTAQTASSGGWCLPIPGWKPPKKKRPPKLKRKPRPPSDSTPKKVEVKYVETETDTGVQETAEEAKPVQCQPGYVRIGTSCIKRKPTACPEGKERDKSGKCVDIVCPDGFVLSGSTCVPIETPVSVPPLVIEAQPPPGEEVIEEEEKGTSKTLMIGGILAVLAVIGIYAATRKKKR